MITRLQLREQLIHPLRRTLGEFSQAVRFTYRQIITISTESSIRLI